MSRLQNAELESLLAEVKRVALAGTIPPAHRPGSREQLICWVYGNCSLDNPEVTKAIVEKVVDDYLRREIY